MVSIIVVNYNGERFLERCVSSILNSDYPSFELIIVDNGSTDGSVDILREKFKDDKRLRIIINETNVGFSAANNIGFDHSKSLYLAFVNNDTEVNPNWLRELIRVSESDRRIGACQSRLRIMGTQLLDGAGDYITIHGISFIRSHRVKDEGHCRSYEIFSPRAAAMVVKRHVFVEAGGFDPDYFTGYEDVDLGWRIRLIGYKILFVPRSVVNHTGRASTSRIKELESFHKHKNCFMTVIKNYSLKNIFLKLPATVLLRLFLSFSPFDETHDLSKFGFAGLKALIWIIKEFPRIWKKHVWVQQNVRRVSDRHIRRLMFGREFEIDLLRYFLFYRRKYELWQYLHHLIDTHQGVFFSDTIRG